MMLRSFLFGGSGLFAITMASTIPCTAQTVDPQPGNPPAQAATESPQQATIEIDEARAATPKERGATAGAQRLLTGKPVPAKAAVRQNGKGDEGPRVSNESGRLTGDIVVVGIKESAASARNAKRRASQIVDVILAQDVGKLPDRNVTEALSRVPGIQITRTRGEGAEVKIRGLSGVMTTVNGSQSMTGEGRGAALNNISSDLIGSIEVFKTRTPDQIEGSQTGVVNVSLRRPTDFKQGPTYIFSLNYDYADQVRTFNPTATAIVGYNGETALGQMGFLVTGTFSKFLYNESTRWNGFPGRPTDNRQIIEPTATPADIFMPGTVGFTTQDGSTRRTGLQISSEWRPDDHWRFIAEGGFNNTRGTYVDSDFNIPLFDPQQRLSNIVLSADGRTVKSTSVDGTMPFGPGRQYRPGETRDYNARFEVDYKSDRFETTAWMNYTRSNDENSNLYHWVRYNQAPKFDVTFNTDKDPKGGPDVSFKGVDLLDRKNYRYVDGFTQGRYYGYSKETEFKADLKLNTFSQFIDHFKFGVRYANRTIERNDAYRTFGDLRVPMSALPGYKLSQVKRGFAGSNAAANASWLMGDASSFAKALPTFLSLVSHVDPGLTSLKPRYPTNEFYGGGEKSYAVYGMLHYNIKLGFPIEGVLGVRAVNTLNQLKAFGSTRENVLENGITRIVEQTTPATADGNYLDVMPSLNAVVHFTDKMQLRLAYTRDIGRPDLLQLSPRIALNLEDRGAPTASGGNPNLGPIESSKYDASLEWYFGRTGVVSLAAWQWNQDGLIANRIRPEFIGKLDGVPVQAERPRNLGRGKFRGIEGRASTFFSFLPGILQSFGVDVNGTINITRQAYPTFDKNNRESFIYGPYLFVSKYVYNVQGFYERNGLNIRVAYNWQSRQQIERSKDNPYANQYQDPIERLDSQIGYDINKNLSIALQANNLTRNGVQWYYGSRDLPRDIRYFSRQYSARITARF
ncbi:TonB-dependent receptor [Sphingomonas sp. Leaf231]|uniref:TonB-dependent receptor n=1 Tax=Sphingomonas sp. Leaf231 TaxID=1736301 RepID=UPI0009E9CF9A|nr:TonB-dependent receptor [Sphingomonas sp. Leaf231]